jgi:hypothetical protein
MNDEERRKWLAGLQVGHEVAIVWSDGIVQRQFVSDLTSRTIYLGNGATFHAQDGRSGSDTIRPVNQDDRLCWQMRNKFYEVSHGHKLSITKVRKLLAALEEIEQPKENV